MFPPPTDRRIRAADSRSSHGCWQVQIVQICGAQSPARSRFAKKQIDWAALLFDRCAAPVTTL
jgi:hypothetical protein